MGTDGLSLLRGNGFQHTSFEGHPYGRALQRLGEFQRRTLSLQQRCERGTALVRSTIPRIASSSRFPQVSPLRYSASVLTPGNRRGLVRCLMHRLVLLAGHLQWLAIHVDSSCPKRRLLGGRIKAQTSKKKNPFRFSAQQATREKLDNRDISYETRSSCVNLHIAHRAFRSSSALVEA